MYSRWAEWTAAALLYRHNTITEDSTSSVASNCRVITKNTHFTISYLQVLAIVALMKWRLYSQLTANPKAEALWRMTETAGEKQRGTLIRDTSIHTSIHLWHSHRLFDILCYVNVMSKFPTLMLLHILFFFRSHAHSKTVKQQDESLFLQKTN